MKKKTLVILCLAAIASCSKAKKNENKSETLTLYAAPATGTWKGSADKVQKNGASLSCQLAYKLEQFNNRLDLFELNVQCSDGQNWVAPAQDWWMLKTSELPSSVENTYGTLPEGAYALVESSALGRAKIRGWTTANGHEFGLKTPQFDIEMKSQFLEKSQTPTSTVSEFRIYNSSHIALMTFPASFNLTRSSESVDRKSYSAYPLAASELSATQDSNATKVLCRNGLEFGNNTQAFTKIDFEGSDFANDDVRFRSALRGNGFDRAALSSQGFPTLNRDKEKGIARIFLVLKDGSGFTHRVTLQTTNFITARMKWQQEGSDFSEESLCYFLQQ